MLMTKMSLVGPTVEKLPFGSNPTAPLTHCNCRTLDDDNVGVNKYFSEIFWKILFYWNTMKKDMIVIIMVLGLHKKLSHC